MNSNKCQNWLMGSQGAKSHCWGIQLWGTDSKSRVTEFPVIAKVSDIQSSIQKPQQFKTIFLNTALTASEISEFSHNYLTTKRKEAKRRPCLSVASLRGVTVDSRDSKQSSEERPQSPSLTIQRNLKASFKSTETRDWLRYGMHILSVAQSLAPQVAETVFCKQSRQWLLATGLLVLLLDIPGSALAVTHLYLCRNRKKLQGILASYFLGHLGPHLSNPPFSLVLGWSDGDNGCWQWIYSAALHSYHVPRRVTEERQGYIWSLGAPGYTGYSVFLQLLLLLVPKLYWRHSLARAPL